MLVWVLGPLKPTSTVCFCGRVHPTAIVRHPAFVHVVMLSPGWPKTNSRRRTGPLLLPEHILSLVAVRASPSLSWLHNPVAMSMPATGTREIFGFRRNASQIIIVGVLTVLCGFTLQLQTSITVDAAGRQFSQGSYVAKLAFLAPFALAKVGQDHRSVTIRNLCYHPQ